MSKAPSKPAPSAHRKLMSLLCLLLLASTTVMLVAGCGGTLVPEQQARAAGAFQNYEQVAESYSQIVPGMTQAQDLTNLGFDTGAARVLSAAAIEQRFQPAQHNRPDPAVQACIRAEVYCTGYVFHAAGAGQRVRVADLLALARSGPWSADVTLLVMNGRVVHKVIAAGGQPAPARLARNGGGSTAY